MGHKNKSAIQAALSNYLKEYRIGIGISQAEMARRICISLRSYADLEHGVSGFSSTTLVYFLTLLPPERQVAVLAALRQMLPK